MNEFVKEALDVLSSQHPEIMVGHVEPDFPQNRDGGESMVEAISARLDATREQVMRTVAVHSTEIDEIVQIFAEWMSQRAIVRVLGAGRARLAAAIPANRMAHGGARVYIQDGIIPMPHSLAGGGVLAASASGMTPSVLDAMRGARENNKDIICVGVAGCGADVFRRLCDVFVGIQAPRSEENPLSALADTEEYVISELLDAMVVAAGLELGFTDTRWRLGHEDLGPATGPYDFLPRS